MFYLKQKGWPETFGEQVKFLRSAAWMSLRHFGSLNQLLAAGPGLQVSGPQVAGTQPGPLPLDLGVHILALLAGPLSAEHQR